jgi:hypothetical protein
VRGFFLPHHRVATKARGHAESLAPIIARLDPDGTLSLRALAKKLTAERLPTPHGAAALRG